MSSYESTTALSIFQFHDQEVRVYIDAHGKPWWVAHDVCTILDIRNVPDAMARLRLREKNTLAIYDGIPGNPHHTIINEPGLYRLIFRSNKPEAEAFQDWVYHEVLPSIRGTGTYGVPDHITSLLGRLVETLERLEARVSVLETQPGGRTSVSSPAAPSPHLPLSPSASYSIPAARSFVKQHFLYFFPLPHGQGSFRPVFGSWRTIGWTGVYGP